MQKQSVPLRPTLGSPGCQRAAQSSSPAGEVRSPVSPPGRSQKSGAGLPPDLTLKRPSWGRGAALLKPQPYNQTGFPRAFLLLLSCSAMSDSLRPHGLWPARLLRPWDFPGKNTGVGCLQGIFLTQGSNPCAKCRFLGPCQQY